MRPEFEKLAYDLSLIYAQEKFRQMLSNNPSECEDSAAKLNQMDFLKTEFAFAFDMYLNCTDEGFAADFVYAFK